MCRNFCFGQFLEPVFRANTQNDDECNMEYIVDMNFQAKHETTDTHNAIAFDEMYNKAEKTNHELWSYIYKNWLWLRLQRKRSRRKQKAKMKSLCKQAQNECIVVIVGALLILLRDLVLIVVCLCTCTLASARTAKKGQTYKIVFVFSLNLLIFFLSFSFLNGMFCACEFCSLCVRLDSATKNKQKKCTMYSLPLKNVMQTL